MPRCAASARAAAAHARVRAERGGSYAIRQLPIQTSGARPRRVDVTGRALTRPRGVGAGGGRVNAEAASTRGRARQRGAGGLTRHELKVTALLSISRVGSISRVYFGMRMQCIKLPKMQIRFRDDITRMPHGRDVAKDGYHCDGNRVRHTSMTPHPITVASCPPEFCEGAVGVRL